MTDENQQGEMKPIIGGILLFVAVLVVPFVLRGNGSFVNFDTTQGDIYRTLNAPVAPIIVTCIALACGYFGGLLVSRRSRFAITCFAAAVATALNTFAQPLPTMDALVKLNMFSGICGQRDGLILATPIALIVVLVVAGFVCLANRPAAEIGKT